jgi:hypothetical protein
VSSLTIPAPTEPLVDPETGKINDIWYRWISGVSVSGSWTPYMSFGNDATGITYTTQTGTYRKVGGMVHVEGRVVLTSNGSGTGTARVTGLPFTCAGAVGVNIGGGHPLVSVAGTLATATGIFCYVDGGTTNLVFAIPGAAAVTLATEANFTDTADFYFAAHYPAAS